MKAKERKDSERNKSPFLPYSVECMIRIVSINPNLIDSNPERTFGETWRLTDENLLRSSKTVPAPSAFTQTWGRILTVLQCVHRWPVENRPERTQNRCQNLVIVNMHSWKTQNGFTVMTWRHVGAGLTVILSEGNREQLLGFYFSWLVPQIMYCEIHTSGHILSAWVNIWSNNLEQLIV